MVLSCNNSSPIVHDGFHRDVALSSYMVLCRVQLSLSPQQQRQQQRSLITGLLQTVNAPNDLRRTSAPAALNAAARSSSVRTMARTLTPRSSRRCVITRPVAPCGPSAAPVTSTRGAEAAYTGTSTSGFPEALTPCHLKSIATHQQSTDEPLHERTSPPGEQDGEQ